MHRHLNAAVWAPARVQTPATDRPTDGALGASFALGTAPVPRAKLSPFSPSLPLVHRGDKSPGRLVATWSWWQGCPVVRLRTRRAVHTLVVWSGRLSIGQPCVGEGWTTSGPEGLSTPLWCGQGGCPRRARMASVFPRAPCSAVAFDIRTPPEWPAVADCLPAALRERGSGWAGGCWPPGTGGRRSRPAYIYLRNT